MEEFFYEIEVFRQEKGHNSMLYIRYFRQYGPAKDRQNTVDD